jgi:acyl-CoA dehydrogenase
MALVLTEEQSMLRDGARNFLRKNAPVSHLRRLRDSRDATGFSRGLWSEFVNMGWPGILVPADYGGLGLGHVETGVIMEELGHTLAPSPMFSTAIVAASAIARGASDAHKRVYLPKIAAGEIIATLAIDETTKHRPAQIAMTASRTTGGFTLKGRKVFVVDGHVADLFIVAARTAGASGDQ